MKFLVFNLPWGRGRARTLKEFVATGKDAMELGVPFQVHFATVG